MQSETFATADYATLTTWEPALIPTSSSSQLDTPLIYHILVQGTLDPSWSPRMEGLTIEVQCHANISTCTVLSGLLQDQAALNGVLSTLYMLGFPLLEVKSRQADEPPGK